jgi:DNA-binding transcriptional MerR regulator
LAELRTNSPRPTDLDGDFITLRELSHRTNVSEHYLRERAIAGDLGPVDRRNLSGTGQAHLVVSRTVLHPNDPALGTPQLPADWLQRHRRDLLLIGEVVLRTGLTPSVIRAAVKAGQLRSSITDGGTHRFDPADVDAFGERRGRACLTPKAAAARAGVHPEVLRDAHRRGELPAELTPGGHARYAVDVLDAWVESRRGSRC